MQATTGHLGTDAKTLPGQLRNGQSIAQIANGRSAQGASVKVSATRS